MQLNEIAQPIYYHASFNQIKKFWSLSHFGTYRAALSRIVDVLDDTVDDATPLEDTDILLYPVRLKIENPLRTPDIYNERPYIVEEVSDFMLRKFKHDVTPDQKHQLEYLSTRSTTPKTIKTLTHILHDLGHDGLSYVNKVEDPGHISYMNLSSDQVQMLAPPIKIPTRKLYQLKKSRIGTWREPQQEQMQPHQFATNFDMPHTSGHTSAVVTIRHDTLGI